MPDRYDVIWITAVIAALCAVFAGMAYDAKQVGLAFALVCVSVFSLIGTALAYLEPKKDESKKED